MTITRDNYHLFFQEPPLLPEERAILVEMQRKIAGQVQQRDLSLWQIIHDGTRIEHAEYIAARRCVTEDWSDMVREHNARIRLERAGSFTKSVLTI